MYATIFIIFCGTTLSCGQQEIRVSGTLHLGKIDPYWLEADQPLYVLKGSKSEAQTTVVKLSIPAELLEKVKQLDGRHVVAVGLMDCTGNWAVGALCNMLIKQIDIADANQPLTVSIVDTLKNVPVVSIGSGIEPKFVEYVSSGNYFKCSIPSDWSVYEPGFGLSEEEKKVYGVTLFGPRSGSPVSPVISIHYYAPGNLLHKTIDMFIRLHSEPVFGKVSKGESFDRVQQIEIVGRKAKTFERIRIDYIGGEVLNPRSVSKFEKYVVIPAREDVGFYVLELSVPLEIKEQCRVIFEQSVKSFLPGR